MTRKYKNESLMKFLTIIGALVGLVTLILRIILPGFGNIGFVDPVFAINWIVNFIIGLVIVILTFVVALRPDDPIPFHWLVLIFLAILLVLFGAGIWACVLVIIAALIGLI